MIPTPPKAPEGLTLDAWVHDPIWDKAIVVMDEMVQCALSVLEVAQQQDNKRIIELCLSLSRALASAKQSWQMTVTQPGEHAIDFESDQAKHEEIENVQRIVIEILQIGHDALVDASAQLNQH